MRRGYSRRASILSPYFLGASLDASHFRHPPSGGTDPHVAALLGDPIRKSSSGPGHSTRSLRSGNSVGGSETAARHISRTAGGPGKGPAGKPVNSNQDRAGRASPGVGRTGGTGVAFYMSRCIPASLGRWEGLLHKRDRENILDRVGVHQLSSWLNLYPFLGHQGRICYLQHPIGKAVEADVPRVRALRVKAGADLL